MIITKQKQKSAKFTHILYKHNNFLQLQWKQTSSLRKHTYSTPENGNTNLEQTNTFQQEKEI